MILGLRLFYDPVKGISTLLKCDKSHKLDGSWDHSRAWFIPFNRLDPHSRIAFNC